MHPLPKPHPQKPQGTAYPLKIWSIGVSDDTKEAEQRRQSSYKKQPCPRSPDFFRALRLRRRPYNFIGSGPCSGVDIGTRPGSLTFCPRRAPRPALSVCWLPNVNLNSEKRDEKVGVFVLERRRISGSFFGQPNPYIALPHLSTS